VDGANGFDSVSCASAQLCVASDDHAHVLTSTNPTGGASAWVAAAVDGATDGSNTLGAVSCPSSSLCVTSGSGAAGEPILTSTNPTGGTSAWTRTAAPNNVPLETISCPSTRLCVAEDPAFDMITTTNPTGGASAWKAVDEGQPNHMGAGVSCPTLRLCVAVGNDDVLTSTNP